MEIPGLFGELLFAARKASWESNETIVSCDVVGPSAKSKAWMCFWWLVAEDFCFERSRTLVPYA